MFIKSYYCCGTCKAEYTTKEQAIQCEEMETEDNFPPAMKEGDEVNFFDEIIQMPEKGEYIGKIFLSTPQHNKHLACIIVKTKVVIDETGKEAIIERGLIFQPFRDREGKLKEKLISQQQMSWREGFFEKVSQPQIQVLEVKPKAKAPIN